MTPPPDGTTETMNDEQTMNVFLIQHSAFSIQHSAFIVAVLLDKGRADGIGWRT